MKKIKFTSETTEHFKSFEEFAENPEMAQWTSESGNHRATEYRKMYESYKNSPDPKGLVSEFQKIRASLAPEAKAMATVYDVAGDYVDVDRYLSGDPECMVDYQNEAGVKFINVSISIGRPHFVSNDGVMKYCARILNIIDEMENNGFRCKIDLVADLYERDGRRLRYKLCIDFKNYQGPIDYKTFALAVLDNDFVTKYLIPYCDYFKRKIRTVDSVTVDHYHNPASIREKQSESEIYFPSMYFNGKNDSYFRLIDRGNTPSANEIINDIGINFLFPGAN